MILVLTGGLVVFVGVVAMAHVTSMMAMGISRYPELGRGAGLPLLAVLADGGLAVAVLAAGGPPGLLQVAVWVMLPVIGLAIFGLAGRWMLYLTLPPRGAR